MSRSSKYIEPTVKLQNFVAADPNKLQHSKTVAKQSQSNRFTSSGIKDRKVSDITDKDEDDDDYSEDFDSLSRSQVGASLNKISLKKTLKGKQDEDSYSNEFESLADSKSASNNEGSVLCFMCKLQIPKSQALQHNKVCTKVSMSKANRNNKDNVSPIREAEDEEAQSLKGSSSRGSKQRKSHKS